VVGETGQKILRAIIAANATGMCLHASGTTTFTPARMKSPKSLVGNWREEHLFALKQAMALYDFLWRATGGMRSGTGNDARAPGLV